jgi:hypothetical protein
LPPHSSAAAKCPRTCRALAYEPITFHRRGYTSAGRYESWKIATEQEAQALKAPQNERIKRAYFIYLAEAKGFSEATLDGVAKALNRFETYTKFRDFKASPFSTKTEQKIDENA